MDVSYFNMKIIFYVLMVEYVLVSFFFFFNRVLLEGNVDVGDCRGYLFLRYWFFGFWVIVIKVGFFRLVILLFYFICMFILLFFVFVIVFIYVSFFFRI